MSEAVCEGTCSQFFQRDVTDFRRLHLVRPRPGRASWAVHGRTPARAVDAVCATHVVTQIEIRTSGQGLFEFTDRIQG